MKKLIFPILFVTNLFIWSACNTDGTASFDEQVSKAKEAYTSVKNAMPDSVTTKNLIVAYENYVKNAPKDEKSAEYLFNTGQLYQQLHDFKTAVGTFESVYQQYPQSAKAPNALFLMAMSYKDNLNDTTKAKQYYAEFLQKFPQHELADDAKILLENIGKTDEQMFEELMKKAAAQGDTTAMAIQKQKPAHTPKKK